VRNNCAFANPDVRQEPVVPCGPVDDLLLSLPNAAVAGRLCRQLAATGVEVTRSDLGLKIPCHPHGWQLLLQSIAASLSPAEQRDTRVALLPSTHTAAQIHHAVFRAQSLDLLLGQVQQSWLDQVLSRDGIVIHLQPLIQFPPGRLHGYECLMRGLDADGSLISPVRMFDAARKLDRLPLLDGMCRAAAFRAAARIHARKLTFFINFMPSAVNHPSRFLTQTMQDLEAAGLQPSQVTFEVVETDRIQGQRDLLAILRYLRKAGFKIALDDVGAGYASLLSLSQLRPDYIKLDGELVRRAAGSALEAKLVADLAETARQNGIITIAEGIETPDQLHLVQQCRIPITQGYFHARPQPQPLDRQQLRAILDRTAQIASSAPLRQTA
jgi:EAL domain-containing protein (putative c-di-GMP-specific phosphodiesterase class I)